MERPESAAFSVAEAFVAVVELEADSSVLVLACGAGCSTTGASAVTSAATSAASVEASGET